MSLDVPEIVATHNTHVGVVAGGHMSLDVREIVASHNAHVGVMAGGHMSPDDIEKYKNTTIKS